MTPASTPPASDRGIVYVAVGERYVEESTVSAESVRKTNPGLPIYLLTDTQPKNTAVWDKIIPITAHMSGSAMKLHMDQAPWERCLFLDSDTLVVGSLEPLFALLDRFDLAAMQHCGGHHYKIPGLPVSFPEFNSGVIAWRKNGRTDAFFSRWRELYAQMREPNGRTWDQKSMRLALYEGDLRITSLGHGYNLMPYFASVVENEAVVLHGRNLANLHRLHARISRSTAMRAYVPGIGVLHHPKEMSWSDLFKAAARMFAWKLKQCLSDLRHPRSR